MLLFRLGAHYRAEKKYKKCLGELCFERKLQTDCFLVELIFILYKSHKSGRQLNNL